MDIEGNSIKRIEFENEDSITFHNSLGFEKTNRIVCFKKNFEKP